MSDDKPTDMSNIRHWKIRVEDPDGRDMTIIVDALIVDGASSTARNYLLSECRGAIEHLIDVRERKRKAELEASSRPYRDVIGY